MMFQRDKSKDGLKNRVIFYLLTNFKPFWDLIQRIPYLDNITNSFLIDMAASYGKQRPYALSLRSDYTSWDSLIDSSYTSRHLEPADQGCIDKLPDIDEVTKLFKRKVNQQKLSSTSSQLFGYFAQWFTDGFLRTDKEDSKKNTANHQIDLSPLYGRTTKLTNALRSNVDGKLKSQIIDGCEFPPEYFDKNGDEVIEFKEAYDFAFLYSKEKEKKHIFAMGLETGNVHIGYTMINTLFLREHNRLCDLIIKNKPEWANDDERVFQTARNIVIVLVLKIVIEEYINHIAPYHYRFKLQPKHFYQKKWYKRNRVSLEFNLLYRWHSLTTDYLEFEGKYFSLNDTNLNNQLLVENGLGKNFSEASKQPCGEIQLFNTNSDIGFSDRKITLLDVEKLSIQLGRTHRLQSYNDYRDYCGFPRVTAFNQISSDVQIQESLAKLYGHPDMVEYYVGLFAEDNRVGSPISPLIGRFIGIDAFSHALTNPLLAENVYNCTTFTKKGLECIKSTKSLSDIVKRNLQSEKTDLFVKFNID